jgi:hypothetical protein
VDELREALVDESEIKVFLALEIDVKRALAELSGGGDVFEAYFVKRLGGE